MKRNLSVAITCVATVIMSSSFAATTITATTVSSSPTKIDKNEAQKWANEAYIYAYPLATMDMTKDVMTNVSTSNGMRGPMGQFVNAQTYPDANFKDVTTPNADTLYSSAWIDLSKEPYVLHVPDENGRYYLMPMLDAWTTVFASPGTRTTGTKEQDFVIVGPNWKGETPKGLTVYKSATNLVWILGRTYSTGTPEDYQAVHDIQAKYTLTPLSSYGKPYTAPTGNVDPDIDMTKPVRDQVNALDGTQYYKLISMLMNQNPPVPSDSAMVAKLKKLGIKPGDKFDITKVDQTIADALKASITDGQKEITEKIKSAGTIKNGWMYPGQTGTYGDNYLQRAFVAADGLGANLPQDAMYPSTHVDKSGQQLSGQNKYVIHFAKGEMPPVKGFWSLTMYNKDYFFVENPLNKYTVSERNNLVKNADGSIDIYIQNESPGSDKEANWLPAPKDNFVLTFRFYWPEDAIINGNWTPPAVQKV